MTHPGVTSFRLSGEGTEDISMSNDGWLYVDKSLDWSRDDHYIITVKRVSLRESYLCIATAVARNDLTCTTV